MVPPLRTLAPMRLKQWMLETRHTRMQHVTANRYGQTLKPCRNGGGWVRASNKACVGCSCWPSPRIQNRRNSPVATAAPPHPMTGAAPPEKSGCMALMVIAVSISVSPLATDDVAMAIFITSAPKRLPAISKLDCVRVEFSKNRFHLRAPRQDLLSWLACRGRSRRKFAPDPKSR